MYWKRTVGVYTKMTEGETKGWRVQRWQTVEMTLEAYK